MPILIALLVLILAGQNAALGYVWCIGEDGHAALEYTAGTGCGPEPAEASTHCPEQDAAFALPQEDHCGPCLDIPHSLNAAANSRSLRDQLDEGVSVLPAVVVEAPVALPPAAQLLTLNLAPQPPPRLSQALRALRTVVLLN